MQILSPNYLRAIYNGGMQSHLEQLTRGKEHSFANSHYNSEHAVGNTAIQPLVDLKEYLDSTLQRIHDQDRMEGNSLHLIVDNLHGQNKHSTVAIFDWPSVSELQMLLEIVTECHPYVPFLVLRLQQN